MMDLPLVNERRCTGCGDCLAVCPTDCLELAAQLPFLPLPLDCISCGLCAAVCPVDAITMARPPSA